MVNTDKLVFFTHAVIGITSTYAVGKHGMPCWYLKEWSDAVGSIDICQVHGQNSRHRVTDKYLCPPCLEIDPWIHQIHQVQEEMEKADADKTP